MWTEAAQIVCTRPRYFPPAWRKQKKPNWVENRPIWQHWRHVARVPWNPEISREWRLTNHIGVSDIGSPKALPISPSIWREILRFRFNNEISCINTFRYRSIYKTRPSWLLHTCAIRHCSTAKPGCTGSLHSRGFTNYISPFIIIQVKNGNASRKTILFPIKGSWLSLYLLLIKYKFSLFKTAQQVWAAERSRIVKQMPSERAQCLFHLPNGLRAA